MMTQIEEQPDAVPEEPGRLRRMVNWAGSLHRRVTVSMVLSVALHASIAVAVFLFLLHASGGNNPFREREIAVSLISADTETGGSSQEPGFGKDSLETDPPLPSDTPTVQDDVRRQVAKEHANKAGSQVSSATDDAKRKIDADARKEIQGHRRAADGKRREEGEARDDRLKDSRQRQDLRTKELDHLTEAERQRAIKAAEDARRRASEAARKKGRVVKLGGGGEGPPIFAEPPLTANRIIYIVDRSTSMTASFPVVQTHLKETIGALKLEKLFYVIFYSSGPTEALPGGAMLPATRQNKDKGIRFVSGVSVMGGTDPRDALSQAFRLKPELIYLLTDGQFDSGVIAHIDGLNTKKKTIINTICFLDRQGEAILREIAERNGGIYTYVRR